MYNVTMNWIDAIYFEDDVVYLVEAKLKPKADAIGQLLLYRDLFSKTPEFTAFKGMPVKTVMLTTRKDANIERLASDNSIEYVVYAPFWVKKALAEL